MSLNGAFQSGTVSAFAGASGLLQELLDFICGTDVTGASTSGSGSGPYTATLTTPVGLGRTVINYTIGGTGYTATDDGVGGFTGTNISSATIDNATGALSVTFTGTPDAAPTVDYIYGADGQDWSLLVDRNTRDDDKLAPSEPFGSDCKEVILHNTGLSGSENVLLGIREWKYVAGSSWGWDLTGYMSIDSTPSNQFWGESLVDEMISVGTYDGTREHYSLAPTIPLIDDTMYYWFYSNRQRIVVVVKTTTTYEGFYSGFGNRFGNPTDFPYPLAIKGCAYGSATVTTTTASAHNFIPYSTTSGSSMLHNTLPANTWSVNWGSGSNLFCTLLQPFSSWSDLGQLAETPSRKQSLLTPIVGTHRQSKDTLWELDGVLHAAGVGLQSEDILKGADGIKYRIFQNIYRSEYYDWMAVAEEAYTSTSTSTTTTSSSSTTTTTTA